MSFRLRWTSEATKTFTDLQGAAQQSIKGKVKPSKQAGLFKQVAKSVRQLAADPRHRSLNTHGYDSLDHPFDPKGKVFEAYAQNRTPGAYRIFWCYGPNKGELTIIAITPHP
jgi:hypothetical protein